jgi:uncharacterized protein (DUF58 family)
LNLRELNYILIPSSNERWDRWTYTRWGRALIWVTTPLHSLTREGQILIVAILVAGVAGVDVNGSNLYLVFCGLVGLLLAGWLMRPTAGLEGVTLSVEQPPRVQAGEALSVRIVLRNEGDRPRFGIRVRGPFLPWDGVWVTTPGVVPVLEPGAEARVTLKLRFLLRGDRLIGRFRAYSVWPLGLVGGRPARTLPVRVTVVPPVHPVQGRPARARDGILRGQGAPRLGGGADELVGVRPYRPGDPIRDLHARSWARLGEPMVRQYERPIQPMVHVVMVCGVAKYNRDVFDAALSAAGSLVAHDTRAGALVEFALLGTGAQRLRIGPGGATLAHALEQLATVRHCADVQLAAPPRGSRRASYRIVFADWTPALAQWWQKARLQSPEARAVLVANAAPLRAEAEALGVATWAPADLNQGLAV